MANIYKYLGDQFQNLKVKIKTIYRGQSYSNFQTDFIFQNTSTQRAKLELNHHQYPELNRFFIKFLNSSESNGRINGQNLVFLIGCDKVGKSTFVQSNIEKFKGLKNIFFDKQKQSFVPDINALKTPQYLQDEIKENVFDNQFYVLLNFNFKKQRALGWSGFLNYFQEEIIEQILKICVKVKNYRGFELLSAQVIKDIIVAQNSEEYIYIYLKDVIYCILNDTDTIVLSAEHKQILQEFNQSLIHSQVDASQFFKPKGAYSRLISILMVSSQKTEIQVGLRLFLSIAKRIEYENRPQKYKFGWYESGIETTNFLFDILNFICGLGKMNKNAMNDYFFGEQSNVEGLKQFENNFVKNGQRIDVGLFLLNISELYIYDTSQFCNFLDHIIARTANNTNLRTHFPVMIELPNYIDFSEIQNMGQFDLSTPIVLEIPGYIQHLFNLVPNNLASVFTLKLMKTFFYHLGRNPYTWTKVIQQMAKGQTTDSIILNKAKYLIKERIAVQAKINAIYIRPQILPQINDNSIKYQLIQHLRLISKAKGLMQIDRNAYFIDFFNRPIFQALVKNNIFHHYYYMNYSNLIQITDLKQLIRIKNELLFDDFSGYLIWRLKNFNKFNFLNHDVVYKYKRESDRYNHLKHQRLRSDFHLSETYYGAHFNYKYNYTIRGMQRAVI